MIFVCKSMFGAACPCEEEIPPAPNVAWRNGVMCRGGKKGNKDGENKHRQRNALPAALVSPCPSFVGVHHSANEVSGISNGRERKP